MTLKLLELEPKVNDKTEFNIYFLQWLPVGWQCEQDFLEKIYE